MKKIISIILASTMLLSVVTLSGCGSLDIKEQPDRIVISAEKIYPEAIGNYITDISVDIPAITAYMEEYNKNADETAKINYTTIKYNKNADYYYVNDATTDVGMKFRLDATQSITSASIYTGTLDQPGKNVYNIVINAIETSGYKTLMTDEDRALIQYTIDGFNGVSAAKQEVQQIFNKEANFAAKWNNEIAEFEIPVKPSELPKPDSSHTLMQVTFPTVEIPAISLDTTIVEGTHLSDMTPVKPENYNTIASNIQSATSSVMAVQKYTESTINTEDLSQTQSVVDDIKINATITQSGLQLTTAAFDALKLATSPETAKLPCTQQILQGVNDAYGQLLEAGSIKKGKETFTLNTSASDMMNAIYAQGDPNSRGKGTMLFNADGSMSAAGTAAMNSLNTVLANQPAYTPDMGELKKMQESALNQYAPNGLENSVQAPSVDKGAASQNHSLLMDVTQPASDKFKANVADMYQDYILTQHLNLINVTSFLNPMTYSNIVGASNNKDEAASTIDSNRNENLLPPMENKTDK